MWLKTRFVSLGTSFSKELNMARLHKALGELLGDGCLRRVYVYAPDPTWVVKVAKDDALPNMREIRNYERWQARLGEWMAPCKAIDIDGAVCVLMRRTTPAELAQYPEQVPLAFKDVKWHNWGMFQGRLVCHDYHKMAGRGTGLRKVNWRFLPEMLNSGEGA